MTVAVRLVLVLLISLSSRSLQYPSGTCQANLSCMPASECRINLDVVYPCNFGRSICCPELEGPKHNEKMMYEYELLNSSNTVMKTNNRRDEWNNVLNVSQNFEQYSEAPNLHRETENIRNENDDFVHNAGLSGFIPNRPSFNFNDPRSSTPSTVLAGSFEDIRLNIPNSNEDLNRTVSFVSKNIDDVETAAVVRRQGPFKENCGLTFADNKVTGGKVAEMGQFPWMALLAFKQPAQPNTQFLCGGSLITTRHVLTAAHCIIENRPLELVFVRLGEYNLTSEKDCVSFGNRVVCAEQHVNMLVDYVTVHPEYNRRTLKNDIAVIRLRNRVRESDYIRPICLPFDKNWIYSELTGQNFTVSGWGKSESGDLFGSDILQYAKVTTWTADKCNNSIPGQVKPLSETQICANGPNTEDACKGDSGGPLMNITLDKSLEVRHIQFGIVSFGTATCGDKNLPTIYTRVDKYLKWILDTVT